MMKIDARIKKMLRKLKKTRYKRSIREISYDNLKELIRTDSNLIIVDVRSPQEFAENKIKFAINIPVYDLNREAEVILPDINRLIVLYCQYGERSKKAYQILESKGYTNIYSLKGGIEGII